MRELVIAGEAGLAAYLLWGLVFSAAFQAFGLVRLDPAARGAGWGFRLLITPGIVALWPVLAWKWWRLGRGGVPEVRPDRPVSPRRLRRVHDWAWKVLAVAAPVGLALALAGRSGPLPVQTIPIPAAIAPAVP